jgi:hypothetical protein
MRNDSDNSGLKSRIVFYMLAFVFGIGTTILFGKIIPKSIFPSGLQKIIDIFRNTPSMNGWYYYVTATDLTKSPIQVICNNDKETTKIAGIVEIKHLEMLSGSNISFLNGERRYCLSKKNKFEELKPYVHWNSDWAVFQDMKIYAYLNLRNDLHSLLNAEISNNNSFSGTLVYVPRDQSPFDTTIEFEKCSSEDKDKCVKELESKLFNISL